MGFGVLWMVQHSRQPENDLCFVAGFGHSFNHASHADGALTFLCFAKDKNLHSLSAQLLLHSLNTPTALPSQANSLALLTWLVALYSYSLNTKSARADNEYRFWQEKGDPDVQVRCANFPHSASFFRRVRTSRALRVVEQAHAFSRKKDAPFGWT